MNQDKYNTDPSNLMDTITTINKLLYGSLIYLPSNMEKFRPIISNMFTTTNRLIRAIKEDNPSILLRENIQQNQKQEK